MKLKKIFKKVNKKILVATLLVTQVITPVIANAGYNLSADSVIGGFIKFIKQAGLWAGIPWTGGSIFALVLSIRNEDAEGRNKAILSLVCAIALLGIGTVLSLFGLNA